MTTTTTNPDDDRLLAHQLRTLAGRLDDLDLGSRVQLALVVQRYVDRLPAAEAAP